MDLNEQLDKIDSVSQLDDFINTHSLHNNAFIAARRSLMVQIKLAIVSIDFNVFLSINLMYMVSCYINSVQFYQLDFQPLFSIFYPGKTIMEFGPTAGRHP
ncbi:unnamed protein product [Owenia fusiformis]|uniref:Uncharacterized protein n=1 Tax=Owenia fusiformis TaxID=6347 RepID=A0A8S4QB39_OWEFU|nr:unnamed protein product [Owenia fusiformis]